MTSQFSKQAGLASGSRVRNSARVFGQTMVFAPPNLVFCSTIILSWIMAPLVTKPAEIALEDTAWATGRFLAAGIALTHLFEHPLGHARIVADDTADTGPPQTQAPIIIVPQPDIRAPPPMPRRGGKPPDDDKPRRKHGRAPRQPDTSAPPPGRRPDTLLPAPLPHRNPEDAP